MIRRIQQASFFFLFVFVLGNAILVIAEVAPFESYFNLMPVYGAWHGINPYASEYTGAIWGWIYGPVNLLTYAPIVFFNGPNEMIRFASFEGIVVIFTLIWIVVALNSPLTENNQLEKKACVWLISCSLLFSSSVMTPMAFRSMDLTAIIFVCLGILAVERRKLNLSILFLAMATFSKQTYIFLSIIPILFAIRVFGWKSAGVFFSKQCGTYLLLGLFFYCLFGDSLFLNLVTIPTRQPWEMTVTTALKPSSSHLNLSLVPGVIFEMLRLNVSVVVTFFLIWLGRFTLVLPKERNIYWILALGLAAVGGILGRVKVGGGQNNYSLVVFIMLCVTINWTMELLSRETLPRLARICIVLSAVVVVLSAARRVRGLANYNLPETSIQRSVDYLQSHPESDLYFSDFPISHYLARKELVHWLPEFQFRKLSGMSPSEEHWRAFIPKKAKRVAVYRIATKSLPDCSPAEQLPDTQQLRGFDVCPLSYENAFLR